MSAIPAKALIVDDEPYVCSLIQDALAREGFSCVSVHTGAEAQNRLASGEFALAVVDLLMPDVSGLELLEFIRDGRLPTRAVCMTGAPFADWQSAVRRAGAKGFIEKPFDLLGLLETVRQVMGAAEKDQPVPSPEGPAAKPAVRGETLPPVDRRLREMLLETAAALVRAVEAKDPYTRRHSEHVALYAERLGAAAGLSQSMIETIRIAALLHDIGKIAIPDAVLTKPARLSVMEFELIRQHPEVGAAILEKVSLLRTEAVLVRHHHENWDGTGYPAGLSGEAIPLGSRILNLGDSMDAMLMHRTYKTAYSVARMLEEIQRCAGSQFDPALATVALDWCRRHRDELIVPALACQSETA